MPDNIAEIAAGLSKAQREAVYRGLCFTRTCDRLLDAGIAISATNYRTEGFDWRIRLTTLGLAVRAHLNRTTPDAD